MTAELCELRGLPASDCEVIQKHFKEQQKNSTGKDEKKEEPLMTMPQWNALLEFNKKASPLPRTPFKAGLCTAA